MTRVLTGACWVLLPALLPALLMSQSLGDVAKKEKERRRNQGETARRFTNDDVSTSSGQTAGEESPDPTAPASPSASPLLVGGPTVLAPPFDLEDRLGRRVSLSDFRDQVVLLDFWATWCAPCRATMPQVEKLHRRFSSRGLQVIGVNIEGKRGDVLQYIDDGGYSFLFLFDREGSSDVRRAYGVKSIPLTYLIDREGRTVYAGHPARLSEALVEASLE